MIETGTVVAAQGGKLTVEFERPEACEHCGQCDGHRHAHRVQVPGAARPGDRVALEMPEGRIAQASLLAYTLPLLLLLGGLLCAEPLRPSLAPGMGQDVFAALCAAAGLAVGLAILALADRFLRGREGWQPRVVAVIPADTDTAQQG